VKVLGGVLVLRRIATADMAAFQAQTKVNPTIAYLDTLRANMGIGAGHFDSFQMTTFLRHNLLLFV